MIFPLINKNNPDGQVPQDKLAALLEAFGRLKEKVLFKWETDNLPGFKDFESHETFRASLTSNSSPGKPANVILKSFLPQQVGGPTLTYL